jgi:hypothetical protein
VPQRVGLTAVPLRGNGLGHGVRSREASLRGGSVPHPGGCLARAGLTAAPLRGNGSPGGMYRGWDVWRLGLWLVGCERKAGGVLGPLAGQFGVNVGTNPA